MAKLRHIALATDDPTKTAEFYKEVFGFKEVGRIGGPSSTTGLAWGYYLSDGTLNLAILKFMNVDQLGKGLDFRGVHHFGVLVEDLEETTRKLEKAGSPCVLKPEPNTANSYFEIKYRGPDGVVFDITDHPWVGAAPIGVGEVEVVERKRARETEPAK
jgi:catechol 2,3-dioxygenase-like lactoylglutathione lyase family enzyme